jgi:hypothetical protein
LDFYFLGWSGVIEQMCLHLLVKEMPLCCCLLFLILDGLELSSDGDDEGRF